MGAREEEFVDEAKADCEAETTLSGLDDIPLKVTLKTNLFAPVTRTKVQLLSEVIVKDSSERFFVFVRLGCLTIVCLIECGLA